VVDGVTSGVGAGVGVEAGDTTEVSVVGEPSGAAAKASPARAALMATVAAVISVFLMPQTMRPPR
jgi:hypothetical protein